ncbi:hypothetical protein EDD11_004957 [Mortierella claussenii]|nr:hypothetical protein EDD11_004957 [Mortierella claussenii]
MKFNIAAAFAALAIILTVSAVPADVSEPLAEVCCLPAVSAASMLEVVSGADLKDVVSGKSVLVMEDLLNAATLAAA